jgi:WD40 repeat protein
VNFFGLQDEYIVSGSDCGNLFIWDRKTSQLLNILEGDNEVVNVIQGHPYEPMLAVSGIDHTVKIFSPDGRQRFDAKRGIGIEESDHSTFSSIGLRDRRGAHRRHQDVRREMDTLSETSDEDDATFNQLFGTAHTHGHSSSDTDDSVSDLLDGSDSVVNDGNTTGPSRSRHRHQTDSSNGNNTPGPSRTQAPLQTSNLDSRIRGPNPLASRKRMHDEYRITNQNDMDRRRGGRLESSFLTRGMVALLAQRFRAQMNDMGVDVQDLVEGEVGEDALEAEGCHVM